MGSVRRPVRWVRLGAWRPTSTSWPSDDPVPEPALSVWPVAQHPAPVQRRGRYVRDSAAHPAKMLPALAASVISRYSQPGDLVVDPMAGIGTTLVEAVHLGRQGF